MIIFRRQHLQSRYSDVSALFPTRSPFLSPYSEDFLLSTDFGYCINITCLKCQHTLHRQISFFRASSAAPSGSQRGSAAAIVGGECDRESASNTAIAGSVASAPFANGTSTSNRDKMKLHVELNRKSKIDYASIFSSFMPLILATRFRK